MKLPIVLLMLMLAPAFATQEIVQTPAVPSDSKPNDPSVPDVYADEHIQNAVILSGIGSVRGFRVHQMANRDLPTRNIFTTEPNTQADLDSVNGYVINGKVHAHVVLGVNLDRAVAGHLERGTEVFSYAVVTIGVLKGIDLSRVEDKGYR